VDRVGQGAIAVEDIERVEVLSKETLGVGPIEWPEGAVSGLESEEQGQGTRTAALWLSMAERSSLCQQSGCVSRQCGCGLDGARSNGAHWGWTRRPGGPMNSR